MKRSLLAVLIASGCVTPHLSDRSSPTERNAGRNHSGEDDATVSSLKTRGKHVEFARCIVWYPPTLSDEESLKSTLRRFNDAIAASEELLGVRFDAAHYDNEKISYFLVERRITPHVYGGYAHDRFRKPYVFLPLAQVLNNRSPYVHETVHILLWRFGSLSIREGVATLVHDKLAANPMMFVPGTGPISLEANFRKLYRQAPDTARKIIDRIGAPGIYHYKDTKERGMFYGASTSFARFLAARKGLPTLVDLQRSPADAADYLKRYGETLDTLRRQWLAGIDAGDIR